MTPEKKDFSGTQIKFTKISILCSRCIQDRPNQPEETSKQFSLSTEKMEKLEKNGENASKWGLKLFAFSSDFHQLKTIVIFPKTKKVLSLLLSGKFFILLDFGLQKRQFLFKSLFNESQ